MFDPEDDDFGAVAAVHVMAAEEEGVLHRAVGACCFDSWAGCELRVPAVEVDVTDTQAAPAAWWAFCAAWWPGVPVDGQHTWHDAGSLECHRYRSSFLPASSFSILPEMRIISCWGMLCGPSSKETLIGER